MRSLLSFFDESQGKVLVQEKVNTRTQITMADVMTLINNLNEHSGTLFQPFSITLNRRYLHKPISNIFPLFYCADSVTEKVGLEVRFCWL